MASFRDILSKSRNVSYYPCKLIFFQLLVITGAGVSAESGIPTFRGAGGLWRNYNAQVCLP